jgi:mono/diheme cytochrome c family protein
MKRALFAAFAIVVVWILPSGIRPSGAQEADRGKQLFERHCATCHGPQGAGDGPAAYLLSPKPRDFTRGEFRLVTTANGIPTGDDLLRVITNGMPGSAMPPWDRLPEADRRLLVTTVQQVWRDGLRRIYRDGGTDAADIETYVREDTTPGAPVSLDGEGEPTLIRVARGRMIYSQACASCHGATGRGESKEKLVDSQGWPAPARDFTRGIFKGGSEPAQVLARLRAGMKGTAMPTFTPEQLPAEDAWAVVHYVRTLVPPGAQERQLHRTQSLRVRKLAKLPLTDAEWWNAAPPAYVALMPLWWRDERVEGVLFHAAHDGTTLVLRLAWEDATQDVRNLRHEDFHDGAAVQFSMSPDPPFFGMGDETGAVEICSWKASWQEDQAAFVDLESFYPHMNLDTYPGQKNLKPGERPSPDSVSAPHHDPTYLTGWGAGNPVADPARPSAVELVRAKGLGTVTTDVAEREAQRVEGRATWDRGVWTLEIREALPSPAPPFIAFAVWDGSRSDRNGQKSVSIWHRLEVE